MEDGSGNPVRPPVPCVCADPHPACCRMACNLQGVVLRQKYGLMDGSFPKNGPDQARPEGVCVSDFGNLSCWY